MRHNNQNGSTLIEVVTYLFLLSLLLGSFAAIETSARNSVKQQLLQIKMNESLEKISQLFRDDVQNSYRFQTKLDDSNKLHLFQPQQKIIYQVNDQGELYRYTVTRQEGTMQMKQQLVSKNIATYQFTLHPEDLVELDFQMHVVFRNDLQGVNGTFSLKALPRITSPETDTSESQK